MVIKATPVYCLYVCMCERMCVSQSDAHTSLMQERLPPPSGEKQCSCRRPSLFSPHNRQRDPQSASVSSSPKEAWGHMGVCVCVLKCVHTHVKAFIKISIIRKKTGKYVIHLEPMEACNLTGSLDMSTLSQEPCPPPTGYESSCCR